MKNNPETPENPNAARWKDRLEEIEALEALLIECASIDNGSGIIARLNKIVGIADELRKSDLATPRASFTQFLRSEAIRAIHGKET